MEAARGVGLHLCKRGCGIDRAVPDEAVTAQAGGEVVKGAGHRIAEDVLAIQEAPSEAVEDSGMCGGREPCFLDRATPGDVAGVDQINVGEHCRRTVERTPSAPMSTSPRTSEPSAKRAVTPF